MSLKTRYGLFHCHTTLFPQMCLVLQSNMNTVQTRTQKSIIIHYRAKKHGNPALAEDSRLLLLSKETLKL